MNTSPKLSLWLPSTIALAPAVGALLLAASCLPEAPAADPSTAPVATPPPPSGPPSALTPALAKLNPDGAPAAGNNILWNSSFEEGMLQPWAPNFGVDGTAAVENQEACLNVTHAGQNPHDVVLRQRPVSIGIHHKLQLRFKAHSTVPTKVRARVVNSQAPHNEYWSADAEVGTTPQVFTANFEGPTDDYEADFTFYFGGALAGKAPFKICFDDIELNDPKFEIPPGRLAAQSLEKVRVNQVGYLPQYHKIATVKSNSKAPLDWQIVDAAGKTVATGKSKPFGEDKAAGEIAHNIDFSSFRTPGRATSSSSERTPARPSTSARTSITSLNTTRLRSFISNEVAFPSRCPTRVQRSGFARRATSETRASLAHRVSATTRSTSRVGGTTPVTTASTL